LERENGACTCTAPAQSTPYDLLDATPFRLWREKKLAAFPSNASDIVVPIENISHPSPTERAEIFDRLARANMAIYRAPAELADDEPRLRSQLISFLSEFGLVSCENHRSAEDDGFVVIEVSDTPSKRGFIPYTTRPLNWYTDGYYNPAQAPIRGMLLHCSRSAVRGGENALLDPEIAYIRLRDRNPDWIAALMHPEAMTIPAAIEDDGSERPTSVGPVFMVDPGDGQLVMRYTARTRNIIWRDCKATRAAVAFLNDLLTGQGEPHILNVRLAPGEGLICNNVLHTRTGFDEAEGTHRRVLRARFASRVGARPIPLERAT